jgi:hypothetical protein
MLTIDEAKDWLRIDGDENAASIQALINATPAYIADATGVPAEEIRKDYSDLSPLIATCQRFLLTLWYYSEGYDNVARLSAVIDSLLKAISYEWQSEAGKVG